MASYLAIFRQVSAYKTPSRQMAAFSSGFLSCSAQVFSWSNTVIKSALTSCSSGLLYLSSLGSYLLRCARKLARAVMREWSPFGPPHTSSADPSFCPSSCHRHNSQISSAALSLRVGYLQHGQGTRTLSFGRESLRAVLSRRIKELKGRHAAVTNTPSTKKKKLDGTTYSRV